MAELRRVGYWRNDQNPELPDPNDFIDPDPPQDLLDLVGRYLAHGTLAAAYMGFSPCRICGERNGAYEFTDGIYQWPDGLAHYVLDHNVRLPIELEQHAREQINLAEERAPTSSDAWWMQQMRP